VEIVEKSSLFQIIRIGPLTKTNLKWDAKMKIVSFMLTNHLDWKTCKKHDIKYLVNCYFCQHEESPSEISPMETKVFERV